MSILNKKGMEYLFYSSGKIKANKTHQISVKTKVFFIKTELQYIIKKR